MAKANETNERRKVDRGEYLAEALTAGSVERVLTLIRSAFYEQFGQPWDNRENGREAYSIEETFNGYVIVSGSALPPAVYYLVNFQMEGDRVTFDGREAWEVVELTYTPAGVTPEGAAQEDGEDTPAEPEPEAEAQDAPEDGEDLAEGEDPTPDPEPVTEAQDPGPEVRIAEIVDRGEVNLMESNGAGPRRIKATLLQAGVVNGNGRLYGRGVVREAVSELNNHLHESASQGRAGVTGESDHPQDKGRAMPSFLETIVKWDRVVFDEKTGWVNGEGIILPTSLGRDAITLMENGINPGVSLRGYGRSRTVEQGGRMIQEVTELRLTGFDLVMVPGFPDATAQIVESLKNDKQENNKMTTQNSGQAPAPEAQAPVEITLEMIRERPELVDALIAERDQAVNAQAEATAISRLRETLGLAEGEDLDAALEARNKRLAELEAAQKEAKITEAIQEALGAVKYPDHLMQSFRAYLENHRPDNVEGVAAMVEGARKVYDPLASQAGLNALGFNGPITHIAPVVEGETGRPAFMSPALAITETMRKSGLWRERQPQSWNENAIRFRDDYLEAYQARFAAKLQAEYQQFREATATTDLNIPYSVLAAAIDEAFPTLIALQVLDVGVVDANPVRVFYEVGLTGESGYSVTVSEEDVTAVDDTWVALAGEHITAGSVVVEADGGGTTYDEGDDYVIDYVGGRIKTIGAGAISNGASLDVDYTYKETRKGEGGTIERAKITTSYEDLSLTADRLATLINDEAMVFSQSNLGMNAVQRSINLLVKELGKNMDQSLLLTALHRALEVASNSGGTWTAASDPIDELIEKIGVARVKVGNRDYEPTAIVCSLTNADRLSNSGQFTNAGGRSDAALDGMGFVGRVKGLPVFYSTQFVDTYVMVLNREVIQYRTFGNMELKGPFHNRDASTGELVPQMEWYVQEYNGYISPIPGKASYVKVA